MEREDRDGAYIAATAPVAGSSTVTIVPPDVGHAMAMFPRWASIGVFVGIYRLLVRPKSLGTGLALGAFVGLALGVSVGLGTFIHMPIPPAVAWGWFIGGWVKGLVAGAVVGAVIVES